MPSIQPNLTAIAKIEAHFSLFCQFLSTLQFFKLHPLFEHLPVENMVYANQQLYYDAITASSNAGQSGPFIDFMLNEIYKTLKEHQGEPLPENVPNKVPNKLRLQYPGISDAAWDVYLELKADAHASAGTVGSRLGISDRMVRKHISTLREAAIIERVGAEAA